jgi:phenylalanyl-tRNA synthetase beta chain
MKLPVSWLREYVDLKVDECRLGEDLTMIGLALDGLEGTGDDAVLDLDVTTNRVDAMNVYGLAREVAVLYGLPLRPLDLSFMESGPPAGEALEVAIEASDLCPRFCARVLDVRMGPSPAWLRERLEKVGVRPISNLVDLTNYVMMEMGHPSHAFDLAKVPEGRLRIRWAREGERLRTLDGVERTLTGRVGVVSGPASALALAGIMGGESSEVSEGTRTVALEAAFWEPLAIRRAAKALSLRTEASHRFERGADPEGPAIATARIAHLLTRIGAGTSRPGLIDRVTSPRARRTLVLRPARVDAILGTHVPSSKAEAILTGLGFQVAKRADEWSVAVPTWRGDVSREADLVEEVARHYGLDRIAPAIPPSDGIGTLGPGQREERLVRATLAAAGLDEVIQPTFVGALAATEPRPIPLANPLSDPQSALRTSLVMPGLLEALETNARQGRRDVALFEVGRVFLPGDDMPTEERRLGILLAGAARAAHWSDAQRSEKARPVDVFDLIGLLESLFERLGAPAPTLDADGPRPAFLHPGQSCAVRLEGRAIGWLGTLGPGVREGSGAVVVAETVLTPLLERRAAPARVEPLPRFPAVERDVSVLGEGTVVAADLLACVRRAAGPRLRRVEVKDRYDGPPVPPGKVSLMLSLSYQHPERTLTGDEVQASVEAVIRELRGAGLEIRGE